LPAAFKQEKQLCGQCRLATVLIEAFKKGIGLGFFEHRFVVERGGESFSERGLADPDRTFDRNIVGEVRVVCVELQAFLPRINQRVG